MQVVLSKERSVTIPDTVLDTAVLPNNVRHALSFGSTPPISIVRGTPLYAGWGGGQWTKEELAAYIIDSSGSA